VVSEALTLNEAQVKKTKVRRKKKKKKYALSSKSYNICKQEKRLSTKRKKAKERGKYLATLYDGLEVGGGESKLQYKARLRKERTRLENNGSPRKKK